MTEYKVDRSLLEKNSTVEILRILKEEREDYTPEALAVFEEILEQRGVAPEHMNSSLQQEVGPPTNPSLKTASNRPPVNYSGVYIKSPGDAVRVLNDVLNMTLNNKIDSQTATASANIIMTMLRAMEQEFMVEGGGD